MPELPEIEAAREFFGEEFGGRRVASVSVRQIALLKTFDPPIGGLVGQSLVDTRRHGKHLLLDFTDDLTLAVHLGIGGRVVPARGTSKARSISLELAFEEGTALRIVELGSKKRSAVHLIPRGAVQEHLGRLGIDALSPGFTAAALADLLSAERKQLKSFLEEQRCIAGIGNAYSDEILWEAGLAPLRMTQNLDGDEATRLHAAIKAVLVQAIERARADNYLLVSHGDERHTFQVHRRQGQACPRCGEPIASIFFAENSLQYCPACQHDGKSYADRRLSRLFK